MSKQLTIAELIGPGKPLESGELRAGAAGLGNVVTWAVSLRPYSPVIPPLKGGEISVAASEALARHEPPVRLVDVVRQLHLRGASGLVLRGHADDSAIAEAERLGLPLIQLPDDAALHDIEQEIMRECAMEQARREIMAAEVPGAWIGRLLAGEVATFVEAQAPARREGFKLGTTYAVALVQPIKRVERSEHLLSETASALSDRHGIKELGFIVHPFEEGLAVLVPNGCEAALGSALRGHEHEMACGIGRAQPVLSAPESLREARLALLSSALLHEGAPVRYQDLGAERMLMLLYLNNRMELQAFVEETLGPLLEHDTRSATPLLPTIASFVGHGGRLRETASELFVHRNTLAYRLENASQLLGIDLKDADARLAIEMALRALPLVRSAGSD